VTLADLAGRLQGRLKAYVVNPVVTVTLEELRPLRVSVLGEVGKPGVYDLDRGSGVLAALAAGGGLTDYAHRDRIYVLRYDHRASDPTPTRIRFRWDALSRGERAAATFLLRSGDLVVVE
jgi:polysaccharide biosynthesis/export protein